MTNSIRVMLPSGMSQRRTYITFTQESSLPQQLT